MEFEGELVVPGLPLSTMASFEARVARSKADRGAEAFCPATCASADGADPARSPPHAGTTKARITPASSRVDVGIPLGILIATFFNLFSGGAPGGGRPSKAGPSSSGPNSSRLRTVIRRVPEQPGTPVPEGRSSKGRACYGRVQSRRTHFGTCSSLPPLAEIEPLQEECWGNWLGGSRVIPMARRSSLDGSR
jgi:hypothetical protein